MNKRRLFIKRVSSLVALLLGGLPMPSSGRVLFSKPAGGIQILDKELAFVADPVGKSTRPVPAEFVFSQFPEIPEVPETIPVTFPWKFETTATFPERGLNGFGALN